MTHWAFYRPINGIIGAFYPLLCARQTPYTRIEIVGIFVQAGEISAEEIGKAVARVLASEEFGNSKRMRRFLSYIVEHSLAGETDGVKEYNIALAVFDREPSFDPATDTIVRVEARRLRQRLAGLLSRAGPRGPGGSGNPQRRLPSGVPALRSGAPKATEAVGNRGSDDRAVHRRGGLGAAARRRPGPGTRVPHAWTLDGSTLRVLDVDDRLCWEKHLGPFDATYALITDKALHRGHRWRWPPGGAGEPAAAERRGRLAVVFQQNGTLRWQHRYGTSRTIRGTEFDGSYRGMLLRVVLAGGRHWLLTVANHYVWYASQVALLDPRNWPTSWTNTRIRDRSTTVRCGMGAASGLRGDRQPGNGAGTSGGRRAGTAFFEGAQARVCAADDPLRPLTGGGELFYALLSTPDLNVVMGTLPSPPTSKWTAIASSWRRLSRRWAASSIPWTSS